MIDSQIDCIVRFHDNSKLPELTRCIFSLVGQTHQPVHIILATQRFSEDQLALLKSKLAPMILLNGGLSLTVVNWSLPTPNDARTKLLNLGLDAVTGRYVAFLDYDDTIFPNAYEILIERLKKTDAAIAFAAVETVSADIYAEFVQVRGSVQAPFAGNNVIDLMRGNFCPIHSYLIDRQRLPCEVLEFDSSLVWEEDYDLLLRICACANSDFDALQTVIGDYYFKSDGSNSVWTSSVLSDEKVKEYENVASRIEMRRRLTRISSMVQRSLPGGHDIDPQLTIRGLVDRSELRAIG